MLVLAHTGKPKAVHSARLVIGRLAAAGITVRVLDTEATDLGWEDVTVVPAGPGAARGAELVIVLGGDGTLLRAAEIARSARTPLIGVNLGHIGFLAEAEPDGLEETVDRLVERRYVVEERMTIDVGARSNGLTLASTWALNEATVEKVARERMVELIIEVDDRPLSRWGCDGVVCATPTGSTAYAFSAGGPVVWPEVEALLMVPISAHALFAPPMVVSPRSVLAIEVMSGAARGDETGQTDPDAGRAHSDATQRSCETAGAVMWCDGRRRFDLPPGARVEVRRGSLPVLLARVHGPGADTQGDGGGPFTDRLVAKFGLPVEGWRGRARKEAAGGHA
ncbi:MAG: NAD kinase [Streptosporangiaceae bacterium]|nr:NAD kinase [Streptosporangiaceae bacterium]MBV9857619.1 NAD kinase [Streptosporangiaceae bacterium]